MFRVFINGTGLKPGIEDIATTTPEEDDLVAHPERFLAVFDGWMRLSKVEDACIVERCFRGSRTKYRHD